MAVLLKALTRADFKEGRVGYSGPRETRGSGEREAKGCYHWRAYRGHLSWKGSRTTRDSGIARIVHGESRLLSFGV